VYCYWAVNTNDYWYGDTPAHGGGNCNDMATSVLNNSTWVVALYRSINASGGRIILCKGDYLQDMSRDHWDNGYNANNSASSHKWVPSSAYC
jgi:hypothetical protein